MSLMDDDAGSFFNTLKPLASSMGAITRFRSALSMPVAVDRSSSVTDGMVLNHSSTTACSVDTFRSLAFSVKETRTVAVPWLRHHDSRFVGFLAM